MTMRRICAGALGVAAAYNGSRTEWVQVRAAGFQLPKTGIVENDVEAISKWYQTPNLTQSFTTTSHPHTLYQMTTCPYCNKVRALLQANHVPFNVVEVDPVSMAEVKHKTYKKVPQLQIGGVEEGPLLVDSGEIGTILAPVLGLKTDGDTDQWRKWSSEVLARYVAINVATNIKDSSSFIMGHNDLNFTKKAKYLAAGTIMYFAAHKVVAPKLNAQGYDTTDCYKSMVGELTKWGQRLENTKSSGVFHGGMKPSLADTDVYGVLQSIRGHKLYAKNVNGMSCFR
eukprot:PhF_6_TR5244/c0_g1_i1/m.7605/K05309/PTGES2; microsomal prostaglandin-E synthase 2